MKIPSNIITLIAGILLTLISLWYGQNHGLMPVAASEEASDVDGLFNLMMTIATGLFLLVEGVLVYSLIKFRRKKGDQTDGPAIEGNVPLEIVWTAIPTVIVFILAIYSFEVYNKMGGLDPMASHDHIKMAHHQTTNNGEDELNKRFIAANAPKNQVAIGLGASPNLPAGETPLVVNVNGIQYAWVFTYPDTGIVTGELHIPVNHPIQLNIVAGDVIHAFWLPEFRIKQDAIPGRDAQLSFVATKEGEYPIICAELCGAYHGGMKSVLHVESEDDYNQWLQDNTIAQNENLEKTVAVNVSELSDGEFLNPYTKEMGIEAETLAQLHHSHH